MTDKKGVGKKKCVACQLPSLSQLDIATSAFRIIIRMMVYVYKHLICSTSCHCHYNIEISDINACKSFEV